MKLGAYLIKPDSTLYGLTGSILADIRATDLSIVFTKDVCVTEAQLPVLYPAQHQGEEYPSVVKLFSMSHGTLVLVTLPDEIEADIFEYIKRVRGKAREGGIRDKYLFGRREDFEAQGLSGRELIDELAKNRIHAPDNRDELAVLVSLFLEEDDIVRLGESSVELATEIRRLRCPEILSRERER